jgi:hypothetical protein
MTNDLNSLREDKKKIDEEIYKLKEIQLKESGCDNCWCPVCEYCRENIIGLTTFTSEVTKLAKENNIEPKEL